MAGSFKTPCPSCEADVLVKGRNLVGKKIDCAKCKYRFTVPDPDGDAGEDPLAEPKPKAKKNNQKTIGIVLGVVAAAVLIIGGIVMMSGDGEGDKTPKGNNTKGNPNPTPAVTNNNPQTPNNTNTPPNNTNTATNNTPPKKDKEEPKNTGPKFTTEDLGPMVTEKKPVNVTTTETAPKPVDPARLKDPTNLLPGASMAVLRLNFDRLRTTPVYEPFFDAAMQEFFERCMAFASADIINVHFCLVNATREPFVVIRTRKPVSLQAMIREMELQATPNSPINQRAVYNIKSNAFVQALGRVVSAESLRNEAGIPVTDEEKKKFGEDQKMALHYYDSQTVLIGELNTVERYLSDLLPNGEPVHQNSATAALAPAPADPNAAPAAPGGRGEGGGKEGAPAAAPAPAPEANAQGGPVVAAVKRNYMTVHPGMKEMFNRLEANPQEPVIMYVDRWNQRSFQFDSRDLLDGNLVGIIIQVVLSSVDVAGIAVNQLNKDKLNGSITLKYLSEVDMKTVVDKPISLILDRYKGLLSQFFGTKIEVTGTTSDGSNPAPTTPDNPNDPGNFTTTSKINVTQSASDFIATIEFDIGISSERWKNGVQPAIMEYVTQMKGRMAVLSGDTTPYTVSTRYVSMGNEKQSFPNGTLKRNTSVNRFNLDYPPDFRCSFFVELLPYLGKSTLRGQIKDAAAPWFDRSNMKAATTWVPELLVPYYPQSAWQAYHPLADGGGTALGATNYVALSGLGRDSARYDPKNPANAKLLGMTGYNWNSTYAQVSDGLSNTIYMAQVPPTHSRPWIAGGGSTVMGVDPDNPLADFTYRPKEGRAGTYALMGDGSVRFVPDTTDKKIFNAMVTRAGGESLDLDEKLPKEPMPKNLKPAELKGGKNVAKDTSIDEAELRKFEGKWKVISLNMDNKPLPGVEVENAKMVIEFLDKRVIVRSEKSPEQTSTVTKLDPKANPKRMANRDKDGKKNHMIYAFEDNGDKLRICSLEDPANDNDFPKSIAPGPKLMVIEMVKVKE